MFPKGGANSKSNINARTQKLTLEEKSKVEAILRSNGIVKGLSWRPADLPLVELKKIINLVCGLCRNKYVGDINDYHKYGLLNTLSGEGAIRTGICWMLTPNDIQNDGQSIDYLHKPEIWSAYAPLIFDRLAECARQPDGRTYKELRICQHSTQHAFLFRGNSEIAAGRRRYFEEMRRHFADRDLIFFDPDNGLQIKSCPLGHRNSSKFLYWSELEET